MRHLEELLPELSDHHQSALRWFAANRDTERTWQEISDQSPRLACAPKGIYKPAKWDYALSVKQGLRAAYPNRGPTYRDDSSWSYEYYQEGHDPARRDDKYTNRAMLECMNDGIPVGVLQQIIDEPEARYLVLGLATVVSWESGYFRLDGYSNDDRTYDLQRPADTDTLLNHYGYPDSIIEGTEPLNMTDALDRCYRSIQRRRGQAKFRNILLKMYGGRCAISGCNAEDALEAAHIIPYSESPINRVENGILLRSDIHTLFDLGLLAIDTSNPDALKVIVAEKTTQDSVRQLCG